MEFQFQMQQKEVFSATKQSKIKERNRRAKNKSKFVGVRQRSSGKWVAEIKNTTQKIRMWLGTFDTAEEAARAYDEAAYLLRGSNTRTNFINHVPSNSALSLKIRNLLNQKKGLNQTSTSSHITKTSGMKKGFQMYGDHGYKPDLSNCNGGIEMGSCYFDQKSAFTAEFESFDGFVLSQEEGLEVPKGVGWVSEMSSEIQDFERMKVERQISASPYAINGVNEYWENVHDCSDAFWDLPMLCQMFCPS